MASIASGRCSDPPLCLHVRTASSLCLLTALAPVAPQRGNHFAETSTRARQTIAELGARFIRNGMRVLAHGHSRVVLALLRLAVKQGVQFDVVVTEGRVGVIVTSSCHVMGSDSPD